MDIFFTYVGEKTWSWEFFLHLCREKHVDGIFFSKRIRLCCTLIRDFRVGSNSYQNQDAIPLFVFQRHWPNSCSLQQAHCSKYVYGNLYLMSLKKEGQYSLLVTFRYFQLHTNNKVASNITSFLLCTYNLSWMELLSYCISM